MSAIFFKFSTFNPCLPYQQYMACSNVTGAYQCQAASPIRWTYTRSVCSSHGSLARCARLRVAHAPGIPGTFSKSSLVSDADMHHGTCMAHVPWCMPGSLNSGFLWSRWREERSRHSRCMRNQQFYVSGKRPGVGCCFLLKLEYHSSDNLLN